MTQRPLIRVALLTAVLAGSPLPPASGCAASFVDELRVGVLYHDLGAWSGRSSETGLDFNAELIFTPSWSTLGGTIRPLAGISINDRGGTSKAYGGAVYEYEWSNRSFINLGLALAVHDGETDNEEAAERNQLGSRVLFRVAVETGFTVRNHHRFSLMFDHVSNGYLADPNEGLDTLGIRYGYRF